MKHDKYNTYKKLPYTKQEEVLQDSYKTLRKLCKHDNCLECNGTGIKVDGTSCVHFISCNCPICTPMWA
jgi:hypothetical protein